MKIKKNHPVINPFRLLGLSGFLALGMSVVIDYLYGIDNPNTLVPYVQLTTYCVNAFSMVVCILIMIFPSKKEFTLTVVIVECFYTVLIGYEMLGIILYGFLMLLLFAWGFFVRKFMLKVAIVLLSWVIVLLSLFPYGSHRFFFALGISVFNISTYVCIYSALYSKLSHLLPEFPLISQKGDSILPKPGSLLVFQDYDFTERQIQCIYLTMQGIASYKEVADKLAISISVIKKEMLEIFRFFGVKNREMLYIFLSQYNPVYPDCVDKLKD